MGALLHLLLTGAAPPTLLVPTSAGPPASGVSSREETTRLAGHASACSPPVPLCWTASPAPGPRPSREPRTPSLPVPALGRRRRTTSPGSAPHPGGRPRRCVSPPAGPRAGPCAGPGVPAAHNSGRPTSTTGAVGTEVPAGARRPTCGGRGPAGRGGRPVRRPGQDERRMAGPRSSSPRCQGSKLPGRRCRRCPLGSLPGRRGRRPIVRAPVPIPASAPGGRPTSGWAPSWGWPGPRCWGPWHWRPCPAGAPGESPMAHSSPGAPTVGRLPPRPRCPSPPLPGGCPVYFPGGCPAGVCTHTRRCPCAPGNPPAPEPRWGL